MADMDQGLKRIFQLHPQDILALALPGAEYIAPIAPDVATEPQLVLDTLYRIRLDGVECAVNLEAQAYPTSDMPRRCFEYGARASIVHDLPVFSVVLWLQPKGKAPSSPYEMRVGPHLIGTWHFTGIEVYRLNARDMMKAGSLGLLLLVPFMAGADLPTVEEAALALKDQAPADQVGDLESLLAVFIAHFHGKDVARAIIRRLFMSTEILDQSPLYREWVETAEAKGEAKGKVEGESYGMRSTIRLVLEGRFGALDTDLLQAIEQATTEQIAAIALHVTADSVTQVRERIGLT